MELLHKTLASFGVGAAIVDTRLDKGKYRQGEMIKGEVFIRGGKVEQEIDEIYLFLIVQYQHDGAQAEHILAEHRITERFTIGANETKTIPFKFRMPYDVPISTSGTPVYVRTGLDIKVAVDPKDTDLIEVVPHTVVDKILKAMKNIGFTLDDVQLNFEQFHERNPFVQEFHFTPSGGFEKYIEGVNLVFLPDEHKVEVILQVDAKPVDLVTSMEEALDLDKKITRFIVTKDEVKDGKALLESKLEYQIQRLLM